MNHAAGDVHPTRPLQPSPPAAAAAAAAATATAAEEQPRGWLATDFLAGFVTSALYTSATYPIHRVKVLIQTQDANPAILRGKVARYEFFASFRRLLREQGVAGLWRGNTPYVARHVPSISLSFALKDALRDLLPPAPASGGAATALALNAAAGAGAGAISLAVVYPFEFATVRMAADLGLGTERQFGRGVWHVWRQAVAAEGLLSIYQGFGVAVASMAAYKSLYFGLYDTAKELAFGHTTSLQLTPGSMLAHAALAAATTFTSATITYPLDVIRKRLIIDVGQADKQYKGQFRQCVATILKREGIRGLYRFWAPDMVFRLGGGVLLVGYDAFRALYPYSRHQSASVSSSSGSSSVDEDGDGGCSSSSSSGGYIAENWGVIHTPSSSSSSSSQAVGSGTPRGLEALSAAGAIRDVAGTAAAAAAAAGGATAEQQPFQPP